MRELLPDELRYPVLLPVDMQRGFDFGLWSRRWNKDLDVNGLRLLSAWREASLPIVHVRHDSVEMNSLFRPGQTGNEFRDGFAPQADEALVTKSVNSAFIGTDLDLRLRRLRATTVVVFGISTDICVSTTIRVGANMGWTMILIPDACDCTDLPGPDGKPVLATDIHRAHVATLAYEFCHVMSTSQAIAAVTQRDKRAT